MARPQRNNIDYFPHPVKHGKKMSYIENKYKNDGYAVWMKLLEELGDNDYHYLNLSDEVQIMFLEEKCNVSQELLLKIINDLVKLGEFNKLLWDENNILFNEKFTETIADAYVKRNNNCVSLSSLRILLLSLGVLKPHKSSIKGVVKPQRIEEDRIEEKNIYRSFANLKITKEENDKLIKLGYNQIQVDNIYDNIENYKKNNQYKSLFLTSKNWLKREFGDKSPRLPKDNKLSFEVRHHFSGTVKYIKADNEKEALEIFCKNTGAFPEDVKICQK